MPPRSPPPASARETPSKQAAASPGKFERSSSKTGSKAGAAFERSNSTTGSKNTFKRSNSSNSGLKKGDQKNNRVNVYVRVRAFRDDETGDLQNLAVDMKDDAVEVNVPKKGPFKFSFDGCFWSNDRPCPSGKGYSNQEDVFDVVGRPMVENALAGYNAAVMSYGQTGSGKTYTSFGPAGSLGTAAEGLVPRVCNMLFLRAASGAKNGVTYTVKASMLEVYLEEVYDLLNHRKQLSLRHEADTNSFQVVGNKAIPVHNYNDVMNVLNKAEPLRTFAATNIHDHSSRAHTLFMLEVTTKFSGGEIKPRCAKILLADLAGCERIKLAGTEDGIAFQQARNINLSLLTLGSCIEAVASRGSDPNRSIPEFRNSKLTMLLKDYLGGNSVSSMMITIGPSSADSNLSVQTLRFGDRAKQITTHAKVNTVEHDNSAHDEVYLSDKLRDEYNRRKEALYQEYQLNSAMEKHLARMTEINELLKNADEDMQLHLTAELDTIQKSFKDAEYQREIQKQIIHGDYYFMEDEVKQLSAKLQQIKEEYEEQMESLLGAEAGRFDDMKRDYEKNLNELKKEIQKLRDENSTLKSENNAKTAEIKDLMDNISALQEQYDLLKKDTSIQINELNAKQERTQSLLLSSEAEAVDQRKESQQVQQDLETKISALTAQLNSTTESLKETNAALDNTQTELQARGAAADHLGEELEETKEQLQETAAKLADTEGQLEETAAKLADTEEQLQARGAAADHLGEELEETKEQLQETAAKLADTEGQLEETAAKLADTEEQLQARGAAADHLGEELEETKEQLQETAAKLADTEGQLEETAAKLADTEEQLQARGAAADHLGEELEETKEQLQETAAKLADTEGQLEETAAKLADTEEQLQARGAAADHLGEELEETKEQLQETAAKLADTEGQLEETAAKLADTEEQLQARGAAADHLGEELEETKEQLQETAAKLPH
ncbi:Microtubule binding/Kinesin motor domain containing protein, putative [Angomonas deanei]|uniref:Microtubule binding/Kinesin motor domain containing protein, putative n=1 Tax=Angomonas deanei TaxID=59799 RepID=A0A7G2CME6_9TRYP|nr:Microtubule binding/Kinesin motor domain containing protein, putative [Angomonas deanei]